MKSVRLVPRIAAARSIRLRCSERIRIFSVSRGRAWGLVAELTRTRLPRRNDDVITLWLIQAPERDTNGTARARHRVFHALPLVSAARCPAKFGRELEATGALTAHPLCSLSYFINPNPGERGLGPSCATRGGMISAHMSGRVLSSVAPCLLAVATTSWNMLGFVRHGCRLRRCDRQSRWEGGRRQRGH